MAINNFDDQGMLEEIFEMSKEINARAIKENKSENEIIQQMETEAFENIRQMIEEEIENNKKRKMGKKYDNILESSDVFDAAERLRNKKLAICDRDGERKAA
jgi:molecular chaperone GrpE (heat shock protein)